MKILKSETAMGLWNLSSASFHRKLSSREGKDLIKAAYRAGIRLFDTAFSYNEASSLLHAAMKELRQDDIRIITKVMPVPTLRKKTETELRRLGRDYADILLLHWPCSEPMLSESLETLTKLKEEGKARHIGISNFPLSLLRKYTRIFPLEFHERSLSLIWNKDWEEESKLGLKTIAYSPLGIGLLSGKYRKTDEIEDRRASLPMIQAHSFQRILEETAGKPEKALSWVYGREPWCVVSGFSSPEQIKMLEAVGNLGKDEDSMLTSLADALSKETGADNIFSHHWQ